MATMTMQTLLAQSSPYSTLLFESSSIIVAQSTSSSMGPLVSVAKDFIGMAHLIMPLVALVPKAIDFYQLHTLPPSEANKIHWSLVTRNPFAVSLKETQRVSSTVLAIAVSETPINATLVDVSSGADFVFERVPAPVLGCAPPPPPPPPPSEPFPTPPEEEIPRALLAENTDLQASTPSNALEQDPLQTSNGAPPPPPPPPPPPSPFTGLPSDKTPGSLTVENGGEQSEAPSGPPPPPPPPPSGDPDDEPEDDEPEPRDARSRKYWLLILLVPVAISVVALRRLIPHTVQRRIIQRVLETHVAVHQRLNTIIDESGIIERVLETHAVVQHHLNSIVDEVRIQSQNSVVDVYYAHDASGNLIPIQLPPDTHFSDLELPALSYGSYEHAATGAPISRMAKRVKHIRKPVIAPENIIVDAVPVLEQTVVDSGFVGWVVGLILGVLPSAPLDFVIMALVYPGMNSIVYGITSIVEFLFTNEVEGHTVTGTTMVDAIPPTEPPVHQQNVDPVVENANPAILPRSTGGPRRQRRRGSAPTSA